MKKFYFSALNSTLLLGLFITQNLSGTADINLQKAIIKGNPAKVEQALQEGAQINQKHQTTGNTPLMQAIDNCAEASIINRKSMLKRMSLLVLASLAAGAGTYYLEGFSTAWKAAGGLLFGGGALNALISLFTQKPRDKIIEILLNQQGIDINATNDQEISALKLVQSYKSDNDLPKGIFDRIEQKLSRKQTGTIARTRSLKNLGLKFCLLQ